MLAVAILWPSAAWACDDPPVNSLLTVIAPVHGRIEVNEVNCPGGTLVFPHNTSVTIQAIPDPAPYSFLSWAPRYIWNEDEFFGYPNPIQNHVLNDNATVEAYFYNDPKFTDARLEAVIRYNLEPNNPSNPLTLQQLESLTSLTLLGYGITNLAGLEYCTGLAYLFIVDNSITNFDPLAYLVNLTNLTIDSCGMDNVQPLENLTNLQHLSLENNDITNLGKSPYCPDSSWGLMANTGIGAGDIISLNGNPLIAWALCNEIPELQSRGASVYPNDACDDDPQSAGDQDGDGFTNAEEIRYLQYFDNDPQTVDEMFLLYILYPGLPNVDPSCYTIDPQGNVIWLFDTVNLTVQISGQGSVYLGDGYVTEGCPKTWEFAKYIGSCPQLCTAPEGCGFQTVGLLAVPEEGWLFKQWSGDVFEGNQATLDAVMIMDKTMVAEFVFRPEVAGLDLLAALSALLAQFGFPPGAYLTIDRNGITPINGIHYFTGNGIPDAAEFLLLQTLLTQPNTDFGGTSGIIADLLYEAWVQNLNQMLVDMPNVPLLIRQACAAYMTLGDYQTVQSLNDLMSCAMYGDLLYGMVFNDEQYDTSQQQYFLSSHDADADGFSNLRECEEAVDSLGEEGGNNPATFDAFSDMGTDGDRAGQPNEPGPARGSCDLCDTGYGHVKIETPSLGQFDDILGEIHASTIGGELPLDTWVDLPFGQEVKLVAKALPGAKFYGWTCDDGNPNNPQARTQLNGSRNESETLTVSAADLRVRAGFGCGYLTIERGEDTVIEVRTGGNFYEFPDTSWYCYPEGGCRLFRAPNGSPFTLSSSAIIVYPDLPYDRQYLCPVSAVVAGWTCFFPRNLLHACGSCGEYFHEVQYVLNKVGRGYTYMGGWGTDLGAPTAFCACVDNDLPCWDMNPSAHAPDAGWQFDHWEGSPPKVTAVFTKMREYILTADTKVDDK